MTAARLVLSVALTAALALAGCGDDGSEGAPAPAAQEERGGGAPADPGGTSPLALPDGVPTAADPGATPPVTDRRVINAWLRSVREGDIDRAAGYFAEPSKVQNGTPVITLRSARDRLAFNGSLPCGAIATDYGFADGYVIVDFALVERRGADCMGAAGATARGAIKVEDRKITEWYRLGDRPGDGPVPDEAPVLPPDVGDPV